MNEDRILVVGAGFAGATCARALADLGRKVQVIDRRSHIGGNAYDRVDSAGVLIHPYGPHIFHTNSDTVVRWLSRFTSWRPYEHRVLAYVKGQLLPFPINRTTINRLYDLNLTEPEVGEFLKKVCDGRFPPTTSEDVVLNSVGADLCEVFFRGYTKKQWGVDLRELSASVAARIPVRLNDDDRYFTDQFQSVPSCGYTEMFRNILDHRHIELCLDTDYEDARSRIDFSHVVYTGCIDAYYGHRYGPLPYRSLRFEHEHLSTMRRYQPVGTINFPNDHLYTRVTEFKHITGQHHPGTSIVREYPQPAGEPYYPIPRKENEALYQRYKRLADTESGVTFVGRLAQYRYYNMDQVVASALSAVRKICRVGTW